MYAKVFGEGGPLGSWFQEERKSCPSWRLTHRNPKCSTQQRTAQPADWAPPSAFELSSVVQGSQHQSQQICLSYMDRFPEPRVTQNIGSLYTSPCALDFPSSVLLRIHQVLLLPLSRTSEKSRVLEIIRVYLQLLLILFLDTTSLSSDGRLSHPCSPQEQA